MESFRVRFVLALIALSLGYVSGAVDTSKIFFRQFIRNGGPFDFLANETSQLILDTTPTVVILHGLKENIDSESVTTIATAYTSSTNNNVIGVDYSDIANSDTPIIGIHINAAAEAIGNGLNPMVNNGLNTSNLHIIGYWLGAQVAAHLGSHTNFPIPRITGLNPAGPKFYVGRYLKSGDAQFVDIIHTDSGVFDQLHNSGDVDFHPNGGLFKPQPGCRTNHKSEEYKCNRDRSWRYYAESVSEPNGFMAIKCIDSVEFNLGNCNQVNSIPMGPTTPTSAHGRYYLHTRSEFPYAEGLDGIY